MSDRPASHSRWRRLGAIAQGILLGVFLLWALGEMASIAGDVRLFRYQGF